MKFNNLIVVLILSVTLLKGVVTEAQTYTSDIELAEDSRGPAELIACSFNLENYGSFQDVSSRMKITREQFSAKERGIIQRIHKAKCDVVAVQEILGTTENVAETALKRVADGLKKISGRNFSVLVGPSNDRSIRLGYIYAEGRARLVNQVSYVNVELPKISENQKQRFFSRGPLEIQLEVQARGDSHQKIVTLINFHFKSKSVRGGFDPTGLEFEPYRMEMAEAVRRIIAARHGQALASGDSILLLMGDRNSHFDSASARILEGKLKMSDFQESAPCRLNKRGVPLCKAGVAQAQQMFSVFIDNPITSSLPGTIKYRGVYSWVDDILLPIESLPYAFSVPDVEGQYNSGVLYEPAVASDHALLWVALNW